MIFGQFFEHWRQSHLREGAHFGADDAENEVNSQALAHDTGAEPTEFRGIGKVHVAHVREPMELLLAEKTMRQFLRVRRRQAGRLPEDRFHVAVPTPDRRHVHTEVDIRCIGFLSNQ